MCCDAFCAVKSKAWSGEIRFSCELKRLQKLFLVSGEASCIVGFSLVIDGRMSLPGLAETVWEAENGWVEIKKNFKKLLTNEKSLVII